MIRQFSYLLPGFQLLHLGHEPDGGNLLPFALDAGSIDQLDLPDIAIGDGDRRWLIEHDLVANHRLVDKLPRQAIAIVGANEK